MLQNTFALGGYNAQLVQVLLYKVELVFASTFHNLQQPDLLQDRFDPWCQTRSIAIQLFLQKCYKTSCTLLLPFYRTFSISIVYFLYFFVTSSGDCTALQNQDNVVSSDCLSTALNYTLFFFKGQTGPRGNRGVSGGQGSMVSKEQRPERG